MYRSPLCSLRPHPTSHSCFAFKSFFFLDGRDFSDHAPLWVMVVVLDFFVFCFLIICLAHGDRASNRSLKIDSRTAGRSRRLWLAAADAAATATGDVVVVFNLMLRAVRFSLLQRSRCPLLPTTATTTHWCICLTTTTGN